MTAFRCLGQLADGLFQALPSLVAVLTLPSRVEAGGAQLVAERGHVGLVEGKALAGQFLLQPGIQLGDVLALLDGRRVDVLGDDGPDILRQLFPRASVRQEPEAVPHMVGQRTEDRKSTRLNSSHLVISYAVFCLKKKK